MIPYPFICPKCKQKLTSKDKSYYCPAGHCYDIAKSGYVNLVLVGNKHSADPGDNKEMIDARVIVMDGGYYDSLSDCIVEIIKKYEHSAVLDCGCGVGSVTAKIKEALPDSLILGNACAAASKKHKDIPFCVASSNDLPVETASQDVLICAFAPVFSQEFGRILRPGGIFIRVVPDVMHLYGLKGILYQNPRVNEKDTEEPEGFIKLETRYVADDFTAVGDAVSSLIKMTPYYYHTKKEDLDRVFSMPSLTTNRAFEVRVYQKV